MQNRAAMGFHAIFTHGVHAMPVYKRGKFWWTDFEYCRQRVNRSTRVLATGPESKKRAEEVEYAERDKILRVRKIGDRSAITFREIAERWIAKTKRADRSRLDWFLAQPGMLTIEIGEVDDSMCEQLEAMLRENVPGRVEQLRADGTSYARPRTEETISRYLRVLRAILNFAKKKRYITAVPFIDGADLKLKAGGGNALTEDEFMRLYHQLPEHLQPPLKFAVGSGVRTCALFNIQWKHVREDLNQFWIPAKFVKGSDGETEDLGLPVSAIAREALLAARAYCPPQSDEDYVFQYRDPKLTSLTDAQMRSVARELIVEPGALGQRNMVGQRDLRRALQRKFGRVGSTARRQRICQEETESFLCGGKVARINQKKAAAPSAGFRPLTTMNGSAWRKAVERAKIRGKRVIPHGARHTFATWLLNAGIAPLALMELGNWKTLSMMRHYARFKGDHLAEAVALLPTLELAGKRALKGLQGGKAASAGTKIPAEG
jgi:integrase